MEGEIQFSAMTLCLRNQIIRNNSAKIAEKMKERIAKIIF